MCLGAYFSASGDMHVTKTTDCLGHLQGPESGVWKGPRATLNSVLRPQLSLMTPKLGSYRTKVCRWLFMENGKKSVREMA